MAMLVHFDNVGTLRQASEILLQTLPAPTILVEAGSVHTPQPAVDIPETLQNKQESLNKHFQ